MGGAAPVDSGKGGKKSVDATFNLVPFIDLLSCLITFLLLSAVWTQVTALKVTQTGGITSPDDEPPPPDETTIDVRVTLTDRGYLLSLAGNQVELPKADVQKQDEHGNTTTVMGFDTKSLAEKLKLVKTQYPAQRAVTVAAEDAVVFDDLVGTIDSIVALELPDIAVTAAVN